MAKRTSIYVEGLNHGSTPIATATRVGPLLVSSLIRGTDTEGGGGIPERIEDEAAQLLLNIERVMKAAGGSLDDIAKISVNVRDRSVREVLNPIWERTFPDYDSRPSRHVGIAELGMASSNFEAEIIAYIED